MGVEGGPRQPVDPASEGDRSGLHALYLERLAQWERDKWYRSANGESAALTDDFRLAWQMRELRSTLGYAPVAFLDFLSKDGLLRLDAWANDHQQRLIVVEPSLYVQGVDQHGRGRGKAAFASMQKLLTQFASKTGYTVVELAAPNEYSSGLVEDDPAYQPLSQVSPVVYRRCFERIPESQRDALERRLDSIATQRPREPYLRLYEPQADSAPPDATRAADMQTMRSLLGIVVQS